LNCGLNRELKILLVNSVIVSVIIALLLFVALVSFAPNSIAYNSSNYGWNGLSQINAKYSLHEINSISLATPVNRSSVVVVLEIAPSIPFSSSYAQSTKKFIENGGILVIADNSGISNSLLKNMGAQIMISGNVVRDSVYNWRQQSLPIAIFSNESRNLILSGVAGLALSNASSLIVSKSAQTAVIATSSSQSVALNSTTNIPISKGPFAMVAEEFMGKGKLIVIGSSTLFFNSVWKQGDNQVFINNLLSNSTVYLDTSSWPTNSQTTIKAELLSLYLPLSSIPGRYLATVAFIGVGLFTFKVLSDMSSLKSTPTSRQEGTTIFNSEILKRVRRDRERYGTAKS
jgi:hypothetical protein